MQPRTKRRAFLGGLAAASVGGAGYFLRPQEQRRLGRYLHPTDPIVESETFAHVSGIVRQGRVMAVQIAMRETTYEDREIVLFADSDRPATQTMPGPWGFWQFDVEVSDREPGEYTLTVGEERLPVTLDSQVPPRLRDPRLRLTTQGVWRSSHVAHARGYDTGPETGRIEVAFRQPTGSTAEPLDSLAVRTPEGDRIGTQDLSDGVYETEFELGSFLPFDGLGVLQGLADGEVVDEVQLVTY